MSGGCGCIADFNQRLKAHNTRIVSALCNPEGEWVERPVVASERIETGRGKMKAATIVPTFCPFCGTRYAPEPSKPAEVS